jgi:cytochrome c-type biogenesis protein
MREYLEAFALGNGAILGNVCMLPLYPGLMLMLANRGAVPAAGVAVRPARTWHLGVVVLAGVLTAMIAFGAVLHALDTAFADVLRFVLPALYAVVIALGIAMLAGRNPFARMATAQAPVLRRPSGSAFVYGMMLGPMTLPCTGPLIISLFALASVRGNGELASGLAYFLAFGIGFGWPLVVLPFVAAPAQRRMTRFLAVHHRAVTAGSGVLLIAVALFELWKDVLPNLA